MGMHSKSCFRLSLHYMVLTAGLEYTKHAARSRPHPRNLQPNTGRLKARTPLGEEGKCVCRRKEEKSNNTVAEAKNLIEDFGGQGVTGQQNGERGSLKYSGWGEKMSSNSIFNITHCGLKNGF